MQKKKKNHIINPHTPNPPLLTIQNGFPIVWLPFTFSIFSQTCLTFAFYDPAILMCFLSLILIKFPPGRFFFSPLGLTVQVSLHALYPQRKPSLTSLPRSNPLLLTFRVLLHSTYHRCNFITVWLFDSYLSPPPLNCKLHKQGIHKSFVSVFIHHCICKTEHSAWHSHF